MAKRIKKERLSGAIVQTVRIVSSDIAMQFRISKSGVLEMKRGKVAQSEWRITKVKEKNYQMEKEYH